MPEGFKITEGNGFHITFENGWTVSVQIGAGNYSDNYQLSPVIYHNNMRSSTAEIAAWDKDNNWYRFGGKKRGSNVSGFVSVKEVLKFINKISRKKNAMGSESILKSTGEEG